VIDSAYLVANGDQRLSANQTCWPAQQEFEHLLEGAFSAHGAELIRAHPADTPVGHGFISSQVEGLRVLARIPREAPLVVAEGVWQFSQQILGGLIRHRGPVLTVANWEGRWPGLVGLLNLNASLAKAGRAFDTLWSRAFDDEWFCTKLDLWLAGKPLDHDNAHVHDFNPGAVTDPAALAAAETIVSKLRREGALLGVFDEGCMGMYNAIIPDELLFPINVFKERLSQSALYAETMTVPENDARVSLDWLRAKGMTFHFGTDESTELTERQVLLQLRMYSAIARMADRFGVDVIGTQYQLGLADVLPASDLAEGLLNNGDRPEVLGDDGRPVRAGLPVVHFNEADECAGLDALLTHRLHLALGQPLETTLHDVRWGDDDGSGSTDEFVWVFQISGPAPPAHHIGGYAGTDSMRQPSLYFRLGGGTVRGIAHPGELVWSRIFVEGGALHMDLGRASVMALPKEETERRWAETTPQWPIMHAVLHGVSRDQFMARHRSNHIQVAYADDALAADCILAAKALTAAELGMRVSLCGSRANGSSLL